jgi:poly-gamma-glutamate synthesis protein (capsule biosynthesis protein)
MMRENGTLNVLIGGDTVPTESNADLFARGGGEALMGSELLGLIACADYSVFNLEVPLLDSSCPIHKNGPNLIASTATIGGLKAISPYAFALANNHILDQGEQGLLSTIDYLEAVGLDHFGAGENLAEASRPFVLDKLGLKVGFYACAEHEFSIATAETAGANPFDPFESFDHIAKLASEYDYVVVLYHGGKEHYRYPSPNLRKTCRKMVEKGATIVICQHSHCIGCEELYGDGTILYGQGNFLFDYSDSDFWQTGLLVELRFESSNYSITYHPLEKRSNTVRLATGDSAQMILGSFVHRSMQIQEPGFVEKEYEAFSRSYLGNYLCSFMPGSRLLAVRAINKLFGRSWITRLFSRMRMTGELNYIECEAHRELFAAGLRSYISSKK